MGVDHRRARVFVPEQFLYRSDIVTIFQQIGAKGKPFSWAIHNGAMWGLIVEYLIVSLVAAKAVEG